MKKQLTAILMAMSVVGIAQGPVIEATYFPARNTKTKQVWDISSTTTLAVPNSGTNQVWDYTTANGQFLSPNDTTDYQFLDPATSPYASMYPGATHITYIRNPNGGLADSMYVFWKIDYDGMWYMGGYNVKAEIDSAQIQTKKEFYAPLTGSYLDSFIDTSYYTGYAVNYDNLGYRVKIKSRKIKTSSYAGYGTLKLPNGSFNNVALLKEQYAVKDSIFVDYGHNHIYTYLGPPQTSSGTRYQFMRNNTFGSNLLMYLLGNYGGTNIDYGWYTLPVNFGSISGTAFTSTTELTPIASGEAYLYREQSNFTKNDILAKAQLDANGNYNFDSIPWGQYRIAIRPDATIYPNAQITYLGDSTDWLQATTIITTGSVSPGHKIHVKFNPTPAGGNSITGNLMSDLGIAKGSGVRASNPIPGIGVVIKRNPGSSSSRVVVTDNNGDFSTGTLDDGAYTLFVDIPGMHMTSTYTFNVSGTSNIIGFDFTAGTDSIHPTNLAIGIKEIKNSKGGSLSAYPNPYSFNSTIVLSMSQADDMKLEVYDLLGAKVATLDKGSKQAGTYTYNFSAKKLNYISGIYFVKVTVGNKTDVIKIIEQ